VRVKTTVEGEEPVIDTVTASTRRRTGTSGAYDMPGSPSRVTPTSGAVHVAGPLTPPVKSFEISTKRTFENLEVKRMLSEERGTEEVTLGSRAASREPGHQMSSA